MVVFAIGRLLPVDPFVAAIGDRAPQALSDRTFRAMRLDRSLLEQFAFFAPDALRGGLGTSIATGDPVAVDLLRFFPAAPELSSVAIVIGAALVSVLGRRLADASVMPLMFSVGIARHG